MNQDLITQWLRKRARTQVLTVLSRARGRMSFQEIVGAIEGLDPVRVLPQMRHIDGVLFLPSEPAGLTLSPELRQTLGCLH